MLMLILMLIVVVYTSVSVRVCVCACRCGASPFAYALALVFRRDATNCAYNWPRIYLRPLHQFSLQPFLAQKREFFFSGNWFSAVYYCCCCCCWYNNVARIIELRTVMFSLLPVWMGARRVNSHQLFILIVNWVLLENAKWLALLVYNYIQAFIIHK